MFVRFIYFFIFIFFCLFVCYFFSLKWSATFLLPVTVLFRLFIRSPGKQNGCIGYYGILGAFGGENFNKKNSQIPGKKVQEIETAKFETRVMNKIGAQINVNLWHHFLGTSLIMLSPLLAWRRSYKF